MLGDFAERLLELMAGDDFDSDSTQPSERLFMETCAAGRQDEAFAGLSQLFKAGMAPEAPPRAVNGLIGAMSILSRLEDIKPGSDAWEMASRALLYENEQVIELALECFDRWGDQAAIPILQDKAVQENMKRRTYLPWFADKLIQALKPREGC